MKTATVRELRYEFSRISKWLSAGETVQILKHGKPIGRIIPERSFLGCMAGTGNVPDDLDDPVPVIWEAMQ